MFTYAPLDHLRSGPLETYDYSEPAHLHVINSSNSDTVRQYSTTYDADYNRTTKTITSGGVSRSVKDVYVLGHLAYQTDQNGTTLATFTYDSSGVPTSVQVGSDPNTSPRYYYVYNGHGDVVALVDANGASVASYSYDAFGQIIAASENFGGTTTWTNPYRYDGRDGVRYDGETGLYWMTVRAYDPALGRFLSRDPLGRVPLFFADQPYVYAGNNPLTYVDPSGERTKPDDGGGQTLWDRYRYPKWGHPMSEFVRFAGYVYQWGTYLPRTRMLTLARLLIRTQNEAGGPGRTDRLPQSWWDYLSDMPRQAKPKVYPTKGGAVVTFEYSPAGESEVSSRPLTSMGDDLHAEQGSINWAGDQIKSYVQRLGSAAVGMKISVDLITTLAPCNVCQMKFFNWTWMMQLLNKAGNGISVFLRLWYIEPGPGNSVGVSILTPWKIEYGRLRGPIYVPFYMP
jgi:RHS repeat-associated protein